AAAAGADSIELGVPFSDPIADGPVIQAAFCRALEKGFKVARMFDLVRDLRRTGLETPLVCMVSYSLVYRRSLRTFLTLCKKAGFDGAIIPDLPVGYEGDASKQAADNGLDLIFLIAPTTTPERRELIAQRSRGFIYYVSVAGVTGARTTLPEDLAQNVRDIKQRTATPVCVGFGISRPEQAKAVSGVADGVIVGSALVKKVEEAVALKLEGDELVRYVTALAADLATSIHGQTR
ncbi:MAG: tryptophan synthase subunit alpha, partial [Planctomycetota bacterium]|nr:tryptophan synthase subunit alpha [Planctomycetota bacterium]